MRRLILPVLFLLVGCGPGFDPAVAPDAAPSPVLPTATMAAFTATPLAPTLSPPTVTSVPTLTSYPLPPSNDPIVPCSRRKPAADDLLVVVSAAFGISADYAPRDLVSLDKYLPATVVYGGQLRVRFLIVDPLVKMVKAMQAAGLRPWVLSGYRSYYAQAAARQRAMDQYPDRADLVSAVPGHSEHQLGLAIDFGSPELAAIVGDPSIEFHSDFDETSEGFWLAAHAHEYGFSLSYPLGAYDWTGFAYEPWHYRYVGAELATYLYDTSQSLAQFVLQARPVLPCMPDAPQP